MLRSVIKIHPFAARTYVTIGDILISVRRTHDDQPSLRQERQQRS